MIQYRTHFKEISGPLCKVIGNGQECNIEHEFDIIMLKLEVMTLPLWDELDKECVNHFNKALMNSPWEEMQK